MYAKNPASARQRGTQAKGSREQEPGNIKDKGVATHEGHAVTAAICCQTERRISGRPVARRRRKAAARCAMPWVWGSAGRGSKPLGVHRT